MKLALEKFKDIHILKASGSITPENFAILRAGIRKQFQDGKNKIILEIPDAQSFPSDILRDLAQMNLIASELSGQIVLAAIDISTRTKIEAFAKPPVVLCFETRERAIEFFYPPETQADAPVAAHGATTAVPEKTADQFKEEIKAQEINTLGVLRKTISDLEAQNKELIIQLAHLVRQRRDPPDLASWQEKVVLLEKTLEETMVQVNAKDAPKK